LPIPDRATVEFVTIRPETPQDFKAIEEIHIAAFANHPYSRQTEHLIVNALRADGALTVSLVAETGGAVVGHIAFSRMGLDGHDCQWLLAGPLGVLPRLQRQGIGRQLVGEGIDAIRKLGAEGCVLVGDPGYYTPLGFRHSPGLVMEGVPAENIMYFPLARGVPEGAASHHAAFLATA
jgi:putative acetyltransferase